MDEETTQQQQIKQHLNHIQKWKIKNLHKSLSEYFGHTINKMASKEMQSGTVKIFI